ncbi:MAG TPA: hypothetical protein VJM81_00740, partial [Rhizorhapis sp.]|nr:hypothetical protein [Rhizorhapis sp.]
MSRDTKIVGLWRDKQQPGSGAPGFGSEDQAAESLPVEQSVDLTGAATAGHAELDEIPGNPSSLPRLIKAGAAVVVLAWLVFYGWFLFGAGFPSPGLAEV